MSGLVDSIFGGGGSAPAAPDYAAAARETAQGNKEAAQFATNANRINQYTPYGSLTYSRKQPTFDQTGYDAAMAKYNARGTQQTGSGMEMGPEGNYISKPEMMWATYANSGEGGYIPTGASTTTNTSNSGAAPRREDFMLPDDGGGWEQTMSLTPQAQATLDKQMALSDQYADAASTGFSKIKSLMENPNIDTSGMPEFTGVDLSQLARAPINPGMTAQEALLSRLNPSLASDEEALRTRLVNQGIGLGSTAYGREMGLQGQRGTDLRLQAAAQGISLDQAARQQGLNEQLAIAGLNSGQRAQMLQEKYTQQSRPLDLINALRSGSQVQNPQFQSYAQQATTTGPDMLGAANQQYGAQMNAYNAQQASDDKMMAGLMGMGGQFAGSAAGSAALAGLF
jgi:hypothetical protein